MNDYKNNLQNNINLSQETLNAAKKGNKEALLNSLSKEDKEKLNEVLNDKQKLESILKSPMASALLKALGGKNG